MSDDQSIFDDDIDIRNVTIQINSEREHLINENDEYQQVVSTSHFMIKLTAVIRILMQLAYVIGGILVYAHDRNYKNDFKLEYMSLVIVMTSITQLYTLIYENFMNGISPIRTESGGNTMNSFAKFITKTTYCFLLIYLIFYYMISRDYKDLELSYWFLWTYFIIEYVLLAFVILILVGITMCGIRIFCPNLVITLFQIIPFRPGASDESLDNFPSYRYQINENNQYLVNRNDLENSIQIDADTTNCSICTEDYTNNCSIRYLQCKHHYHKYCCDEWLKINKSCPLCRAPVEI